jgi:hypothetical protein
MELAITVKCGQIWLKTLGMKPRNDRESSDIHAEVIQNHKQWPNLLLADAYDEMFCLFAEDHVNHIEAYPNINWVVEDFENHKWWGLSITGLAGWEELEPFLAAVLDEPSTNTIFDAKYINSLWLSGDLILWRLR